jgi:hypothetical protein
MMRTEICRGVLEKITPRNRMAQIELPILARFAAKGQISSLPAVLRSYRRHDASLYNTETRSLSTESPIKKLLIGHLHIAKLRAEQISVLLCSSMSPGFKLGVLVDVCKFYSFRLSVKMSKGARRAALTSGN